MSRKKGKGTMYVIGIFVLRLFHSNEICSKKYLQGNSFNMTENCKGSIFIPVLCYNNTVNFHYAIKKHLDVIKDKMFFVQCITLICIL